MKNPLSMLHYYFGGGGVKPSLTVLPKVLSMGGLFIIWGVVLLIKMLRQLSF
jgi:hypothetical protein